MVEVTAAAWVVVEKEGTVETAVAVEGAEAWMAGESTSQRYRRWAQQRSAPPQGTARCHRAKYSIQAGT